MMGKAFGRRPSEIVGVANDWAAYQFDKACMAAGADAEEKAYEKAKKSGKGGVDVPQDESEYQGMGGLRQLAGGTIKRIKVPDSGVW
ncbi:MAG: hypothetical protein GY803_31760 [Chloroflexi bacterium]|nr:hypothetical protein [Chloroflexota bacterium]